MLPESLVPLLILASALGLPRQAPSPVRGAFQPPADVAPSAATTTPGPFDAGLRWSHAASPATPWIPRSVALIGEEGLVWASGNVGNPRLMLLSGADALERGPLFVDHGVADAIGVLAVAGSDAGSAFAIVQRPDPDPLHRRSELVAYDVRAAAAGAPFAPLWSSTVLTGANGPARIAAAADGGLVVGAAWDSVAATIHVRWVRADGSTLATAVLPAPALDALAVSADGGRVALTSGTRLWLFDGAGNELAQRPLTQGRSALALSGDGALVCVGEGAGLALLREGAGGYALETVLTAGADEVALRAAIARDGSSYAVGWWNALHGRSLRFQMRDGASHALLHERVQDGSAGTLQNVPQAVAVSSDGRRAVLGAWGDGGAEPELVVVDRALGVLLEEDLPGSVEALALDRSGTRIVCAFKDAHANVGASTGGIRLYDTGERDLALRAQPRSSGVLRLSAREPGATLCLFLIGRRSSSPTTFGPAGGMWLERQNRLAVFPVAPDGDGRADLDLVLPGLPPGTRRSAQAAFRRPGGLVLGATVLELWIL